LRVIPETGQVPENGSDCPNKSPFMPLASSHDPLPVSHEAMGPGLYCDDTAGVSFRYRDGQGA